MSLLEIFSLIIVTLLLLLLFKYASHHFYKYLWFLHVVKFLYESFKIFHKNATGSGYQVRIHPNGATLSCQVFEY